MLATVQVSAVKKLVGRYQEWKEGSAGHVPVIYKIEKLLAGLESPEQCSDFKLLDGVRASDKRYIFKFSGRVMARW